MKKLSICRLVAATVLATQIFSFADSATEADAWQVLSEVTHKRTFTIETRDHRCVSGQITGLTVDRLTVKISRSTSPRLSDTATFARADVLRVMIGRIAYYSGRSSWSDVSSLRLRGRQRVKVVTNAGKTYKLKPPFTVSDDGITTSVSGKSIKLSKGEIVKVYEIVAKPLTDFGAYALGELGPMLIFDPDWYMYGLHLERYLAVPLYDAGKPEDNSDVECLWN
jgi:hypothetical protein